MNARDRPIPRRGLSRVEAAIYLGISPSKFDEMRADGRIGPAKLIDGRKVWDVRELDAAFDDLPDETGHHNSGDGIHGSICRRQTRCHADQRQ